MAREKSAKEKLTHYLGLMFDVSEFRARLMDGLNIDSTDIPSDRIGYDWAQSVVAYCIDKGEVTNLLEYLKETHAKNNILNTILPDDPSLLSTGRNYGSVSFRERINPKGPDAVSKADPYTEAKRIEEARHKATLHGGNVLQAV